mmetsp:Transcript_19529/g.23939  ORF Transcript_19529/g.23939 Transcript_19529/m.23939 type:complete len:418 (-) Transcript_19529:109-1362(-)
MASTCINTNDDVWSILVNITVIVPSSLSLLYAVSVQVFLYITHEAPHWYLLLRPISISGVLVSLAVIMSVSTHCRELIWAIPFAVLIVVASVHTIYHVRNVYVLGPNKSKLFASNCLANKVVLITGANSGVGHETARQLYHMGATIILACRSESRANKAIQDICPCSTNNERLRFIQLDLADLSSVKKAVEEFERMDIPLHVLINNAGVMMNKRKESVDGYELVMAANYVGHFFLTKLLLRKLRETGKESNGSKARVLNISSAIYSISKKIDLDDLFCERKPYGLFTQYSQSKLANILFTTELRRREEQNDGLVDAYCIHPGMVRTNVVKNLGNFLRYGDEFFGPFVVAPMQKTPEAGAYTSVYCAVASKDMLQNEQTCNTMYFVNSQMQPLKLCAQDDEGAKKLWELTEKVVERFM